MITPLRSVSDGIGRLERDLERLDHRVDTFLTQHGVKHDLEQQAFQAHLLASVKIERASAGPQSIASNSRSAR